MSDNHAALVEPLVTVAQRALDCLNGNFGKQFILSARLSQKSSTWAVDAPDGVQGVLKVYIDMVELELLHVVRHAILQVATSAALTVCGVYRIVHRLYQGILVNDENLDPAAQPMLTHIDLLI